MKSNSNIKPKVFENLGNGAWYFNYNIEETSRTNEDGSQEVAYDYEQVKVWGLPTKGAVIKLVIADNYSIEQDDLSDTTFIYWAHVSDPSNCWGKIDYLNDVDAIKAMVADSFEVNKGDIEQ